MHISSGGVVCKEENGQRLILLLYRQETNSWHLPKGTCEVGENLKATAKREIFEETGCKVTLGHHLGNLGSSFERDGKTVQKVTHYFLATLLEEHNIVTEHSLKKWISIEEAEKLLKQKSLYEEEYKVLDFFVTNSHIYDHLILMDGDGQHDPNILLDLCNLLHSNDIVFCSRFSIDSVLEGEIPLDRILLRGSLEGLQGVIENQYAWPMTDYACGFKGFNQKIAKFILNKLALGQYNFSYNDEDGYWIDVIIQIIIAKYHKSMAFNCEEIAHPTIYSDWKKYSQDALSVRQRCQRVAMHMYHFWYAMHL